MPQETDRPLMEKKPLFCRKIIDNLFLQHPAAAGETYFQHLFFSVKTGGFLLVTSLALIFHGFVPKFCQTTTSDRLARLHETIQRRRDAFEAGTGK